METIKHSPDDITLFRNKALQWAASFGTACCFDSNSYHDPYSAFDVLIAAGVSSFISTSSQNAFSELSSFLEEKSWAIGYLSYDLKNGIEDLSSGNFDGLLFPDLFFFKPQHVIRIRGGIAEISSADKDVIRRIDSVELEKEVPVFQNQIKPRFTQEEYVDTVNRIREHIRRGDIYEMNFCQEFYSEKTSVNALALFRALTKISPTPFSSFFKHQEKFILSASPERFLSRRGIKLISQPIKGTVRRSPVEEEDQRLKQDLRDNIKEQAENVMIVDLVRNDLTKCSVPGSVSVEELFGIYSFSQVHQMISTVVSEADPGMPNPDIIKHTFPMGSMTGAPKIRAMELIEQFERTKRGVFSGALGYFDPEGDFDFNVVIRSILYNAGKEYLSFQVGSAITFASVAEEEYKECLVKAEAIMKVLS
ncbi:anthranilate synthase component I family protein [Desertivirga xinjiangensis]|uniref:anthranilate synthase component I family protein n=1 Tax=Desertivirga xinjiangensis TaxID=539206 RepID=UPI00210CBC60|nr:anthranilate synthase component I family protein [Pedobacter xinjiangensis]